MCIRDSNKVDKGILLKSCPEHSKLSLGPSFFPHLTLLETTTNSISFMQLHFQYKGSRVRDPTSVIDQAEVGGSLIRSLEYCSRMKRCSRIICNCYIYILLNRSPLSQVGQHKDGAQKLKRVLNSVTKLMRSRIIKYMPKTVTSIPVFDLSLIHI